MPQGSPKTEDAAEPMLEEREARHNAAVALGKYAGKKGGAGRAAKLTAEQRREGARKAAAARWIRPSTDYPVLLPPLNA